MEDFRNNLKLQEKHCHYKIEDTDVEIIKRFSESGVMPYAWSFYDTTCHRNVVGGCFVSLDEALNNVTEHIKEYGLSKSFKIYTSYFDNVEMLKEYGYTNFVSIAGKAPDWYKGRKYLDLAPKYKWWKEWKYNNLSEDWYSNKYFETVLNKLNPHKIRKELGDKAVLLCYEKPGEFCHRHLVANWLKARLGIEVNEIL